MANEKFALPSGWRIKKLRDLGRIVTGKTPPTKINKYFGGQVPFITPSDMDGRRVIADTQRYLSDEGVAAVSGARIPEGSVMVSCIGSDMGNVALAGRNAVTNQQINSIIVEENILNLFVYYNLSNRKAEFQNLASSGSAQPILNKGHFSQIYIVLPTLEEQHVIAHILGTLDDKIELNRRMNETLESIIRAIFKSWFVDYDPVRAKMEGGQSAGMDAETEALFPDSFEDSPLGKIPSGWNVVRVEDAATKVACGPFGSSIKVSTFVSDGVPVISGQHLKGIRLLDEGNNFITAEHADRLKNANVFCGDVIFTHAGNIGQVAFIPETAKYDRYVLSQRQFYLRCKEEMTSPLFMAHYFKTADGQHRLLANTSSTGVPSISGPVSYLKSIEFVLPQKRLIDRFDYYVRPMYFLAGRLEDESRTLIAIRDTLLSKLISGEIRVKDADKFVEEHAG